MNCPSFEPAAAHRGLPRASRGLQAFFASLIACGCLTAADPDSPTWDWLPRATDDDRLCELHLAAGPGWTATSMPGLSSRRDADQLLLSFLPRQVPALVICGPAQARIGVRLLPPGTAAGLVVDAEGGLHLGSERVILAVPRREALGDRRWGILRLFETHQAQPCAQRLAEPASDASGYPVLTRQIAAAQALTSLAGGVLVMLSGNDRFTGWKHREYQQTLAWLVADLISRGATRVVLVEPVCPQVDEPLLAPLRAQVRDVGRVHRCPVVDTTALGATHLWEIAPGVLGTTLNAAGIREREQLLRRGRWCSDG